MLLVDVLEPTLGMVLKNFVLQGRLDNSNQCHRNSCIAFLLAHPLVYYSWSRVW